MTTAFLIGIDILMTILFWAMWMVNRKNEKTIKAYRERFERMINEQEVLTRNFPL